MRRSRPLALTLALALAGLAALALRSRAESASTPTSPAPRQRAGGGTEQIYSLHYESTDEKRIGTASVSSTHGGSLAIDARLVVRPIASEGEGTSVALSLEQIERFEMTMDGSAVELPASAFDRQVVVVERDREGAVVALRRSREDQSVAPHVLELLALETQLGGEGRERTPHGIVTRSVVRSDHEVVRHWDRYASLDVADLGSDRGAGAAEIAGVQRATLREHGVLSRLEGEERIAWQSADRARSIRVATRYAMTLEESRRARAPIALADLIRHAPGVHPASEAAERRMLEARTEGMSAEELETTLAMHANAGRVPDHARFLWRAVAFLELHPESASALADLFLDPGTNLRGRELVLDLLAQAGAEAEVLRVLRSDAVRGDPSEVLLVQRLALLPSPSPEVASYLTRRLAETAGETSLASEYALGTVALRLEAQGEISTARAARATITAALDRAEDPVMIAHHLTALANAESPEHAERIASYGEHADARVRLAAARGLGRTDTARGRERLMSLLGDTDPEVQREALRSLRGATLDAGALGAIAGRVSQGTMSDDALGELYGLAVARAAEEPDAVRGVLDAIVAREIQDPALRARAHGLRRSLDGASPL